jgi:hypothetical protein
VKRRNSDPRRHGPCGPIPAGFDEVARVFRFVLGALYAASFAAVGVLLWLGSSFYATPLLERARHPGYWDWKSGGSLGLPLGMIGASMMVLMLGYSVRKRVGLLRRIGPLSRWLDVHIYLGVMGPLLIVLHSSFKVHGLVAVSFWSMIAVALSGVLGRYLYLQIPRTRAGDELTLAELQKVDEALTRRLQTQFRLPEWALRRIESVSAPPAGRRVLAAVGDLVTGDLRQRRALEALARQCRSVPTPLFREFQAVLRQKAQARRRIALWDRLHELFHYWHVVHKPFAVVMYLFMVVHIAVALMTGYGWVGSS